MNKPGDKHKAEVIDIFAEGQGIVKLGRLTVFLNEGIGVVIGDNVTIVLTEIKKKFAYGKTIEINAKSSKRRESQCEYSEECGGCALQLMNYESQLILKSEIVRNALLRIAGIEGPVVNPTIGMKTPARYRNKAQFPVGSNGEVGFFKARTHKVIDCETCMLQTKAAERVSAVMRKYIQEKEIRPYIFDTKQGLLRHVIVRTALMTGEIMVILVINATDMPDWADLPVKLEREISALEPFRIELVHDTTEANEIIWKLKSVVVNFNCKNSVDIMGETSMTMYGEDRIIEVLNGRLFEISPHSFFQVNPIQAAELYEAIVRYANLTGNETVADLYCGVGIIGIQLANKAKHVIGIESETSSVIDARANARLNDIQNIEFIEDRAEFGFPQLLKGATKIDVVVVDPPRSGCDRRVLEAIVQIKAKRIIYVSCNPATMARDIKILEAMDYRFTEAQPVDMFPHTMSVECVALLEQRK